MQGLSLTSCYKLKWNGCSGVSTWLLSHWPWCPPGCFFPVLHLSKIKWILKTNATHLSGLSPFKYVITETLIGSAFSRGGTDLKPEELPEGTYKEACQQPSLPLPDATRHKPDPWFPDQMFWVFTISRKGSFKDYNISLYSTVKTCKRKKRHSTSTSAF